LYVREGPATSFRAVGYLVRDDVVEELESNPDGSWKRVRRLSDGLTGWCSVTHLLRISAPAPDPDGPPAPDPTGTRYKVTASRLNMRAGPGSNFRSLGYLIQNEIVEELETNADKSWIKVRRADGLSGWCSARYLNIVLAPPPDDGTGTKYRITATRLHVRAGPGTSYKSLGYVSQNEIVAAFNANADQSWRQIRQSDGLVGWSSARYMSPVTE
jgi:uncharacterized protein YgiM (DUF1202 family)